MVLLLLLFLFLALRNHNININVKWISARPGPVEHVRPSSNSSWLRVWFNFDFVFIFAWTHGLNQAETMDRRLASLLQARKIYPVPIIWVCAWSTLDGGGSQQCQWFHFVTRLISNAQMRKIALNVRNADIRLEDQSTRIQKVDQTTSGCGSDAVIMLKCLASSLANSNLATGNLTIEPATKLVWQP